MTLEPGSYIILPRTTGCLLNHKIQTQQKDHNAGVQLFEKKEKIQGTSKYAMTRNFEATIEDIFMKYDVNNSKVLQFSEFRGFCECIGKSGDVFKDQFKKDVLKKCQSVSKSESNEEEGLTL